jgi:hypothetical protein
MRGVPPGNIRRDWLWGWGNPVWIFRPFPSPIHYNMITRSRSYPEAGSFFKDYRFIISANQKNNVQYN